MKSNPKSSSSLALTDSRLELWRDPDWQRLWLSLQRRPWRSLAIVPAGEGGPADLTLRVAVTLARTGMVHLGAPVQVADATKLSLAHLTQFVEEVRRCTSDGDHILLALAPTHKNAMTVSIAQSADSALLCVLLDRMASSQAKKTVDQIGQNRFVGSAIFRSSEIPDPPSVRPPPR
ncbi:MAG TPA: hypothetical protein VGQ57_20620 [Polyangiaceae bacterium]|jgi:hypothetical protein|nr:hypothetical protein [Polyangiaceae bacterium]